MTNLKSTPQKRGVFYYSQLENTTMQILNTVKTRQRAKEIVMDKVDELGGNHYSKTTRYSNTSSQCECGETPSYTCEIWSGAKCIHIITVAYCEGCGDDDALESDVLNVR